MATVADDNRLRVEGPCLGAVLAARPPGPAIVAGRSRPESARPCALARIEYALNVLDEDTTLARKLTLKDWMRRIGALTGMLVESPGRACPSEPPV